MDCATKDCATKDCATKDCVIANGNWLWQMRHSSFERARALSGPSGRSSASGLRQAVTRQAGKHVRMRSGWLARAAFFFGTTILRRGFSRIDADRAELLFFPYFSGFNFLFGTGFVGGSTENSKGPQYLHNHSLHLRLGLPHGGCSKQKCFCCPECDADGGLLFRFIFARWIMGYRKAESLLHGND
jgi:hypothetical protein